MNGLIVNLFKEPITTNYTAIQGSEGLGMPEYSPDYTVWMHYDFIQINAISNFERYFISDTNAIDDKHEGDMQSMHLYYIGENQETPNLKVYTDQKNKRKIFYSEKTAKKDYAFACIATIKLNQRINTAAEVTDLDIPNKFRKNLIAAIKVLDKIIGEANESDFVYDWYGSLGTEELVLVLNADSIKTFMDVLETIRKDKRTSRYLSSTYSFTFSNYEEIKAGGELDVSANLSFTLNPSGNISGYIEQIKRKAYAALSENVTKSNELDLGVIEKELSEKHGIKFYNMMGKYDFFISIPKQSWNFMEEFNEGGLFNSNTPVFQRSVFQAKTNWIYEGKDIPEQDQAVLSKSQNEEIKEYIVNIRERIQKLKDAPPEYLKGAGHILRVIDLLYYDFKKNIRSIFAEEWCEDLYYQFSTFLNLLENASDKKETQFNIIEESINSIRQTYIHITQASRMFFEIPATNLRYTGSFNKILRAYYGIVKQLLYIAYSVERVSKQSNLIPIITFEYTMKVNTHIYTQTEDLNEDRLVVFHLPYEALVNMPKYTRYLCHEIFHYITPSDRYERNKLLADISIFYYFHNFLLEIIKEFIKKRRADLSDKLLEALTRNYISRNSDIIKKFICKIYSSMRLPKNDAESLDEWFQGQSMKFFMDSLKVSLSIPADGRQSVLMTAYNDILDTWTNEAKTFSEEEADALTAELNNQIQMQPDLNARALVKLFDLKDESVGELMRQAEQDSVRLNDKLVKDFSVRSEQIAYGLMEAKCDFFVIQVMDYKLPDYLNFVFRFLYEYGVLKDLLRNKEKNSSFEGRVSIICSYYKGYMGIDDEAFYQTIRNCEIRNAEEDAEQILFREFLEYVCRGYEKYIFNYYHYIDEILGSLLTTAISEKTISKKRVNSVRVARNES